jgi:nucleoside-diphosphate-sugar epimerase
MVTIAVSGGTGKLGRAIVEALRSATNHSILILARSVCELLGLLSLLLPELIVARLTISCRARSKSQLFLLTIRTLTR